ncbi:MAG: hypothetical protein WA943_03310 [Parvibaculum sp.]|uniref:hypothetical protein n=1 Tax=Parvibaculum sp. TaxID=2024848 RepID=UPI003C71FBBE
MTDAFVIEVNNEAAGIIVRTGEDYRFYASSPRYSALEGSSFPSAAKATLAARELGKKRYRAA